MWFVQPKEEKTEGRPHGALHLPHKRSGGSGTDPLSLVTATGPGEMAWSSVKGRNLIKLNRSVTTRNIITYQMHQSSNNLHFLRS